MTADQRKSPPQPLEPVPFNIEPAQRMTLDNGLRVVVFEDHRLPIVSFRLAFFSGDIDDPEGSVGLTSAMTSMLTEGTVSYSSRELAEKIERLGASLSASSSDDFTIVSASSLSLYRSEMLQLIAEVVMRATFPENELDLYRRNTVEHLRYQRSQPNFLAGEQTSKLLYGEHPYSRVSPSAAEVEKITRDQLAALAGQRLVPNNAVFIVVGDVETDELLSELRSEFAEWGRGQVESRKYPEPAVRKKRELVVVDRTGSAQSNIVLANLAIPRNHPDYFRALVMNQILGAGASSRVFMNLREEKGYTYGAYTRLDGKRLYGDFEATAEVRTAVTGDSLKEFFYELERIRQEDVSEQELADAKNFLTGVFPIRAETQEGLTNLIVAQELYGLPEDYLQTYRDNVAAVTVDDVREAARKYVDPENMAIVVVGDAEEIISQAKDYAADVRIFDTDGNPKVAPSPDGEEPQDFGGKWKLSLDFQGQKVPVSLSITQTDGSVEGTLETVLGNGTISGGKVRGDTISAVANTEIQGQSVELQIKGRLEGGSISGTISAAIIPDSLPFSGTRAA